MSRMRRAPHGLHTTNGPIAAGFVLCHRCDVRLCVNPVHLFLGVNADNIADMVAKGRQARGRAVRGAILSDEAVREIRRLLVSGASTKAIALTFGVAPRTIRDIAERKSWRHVSVERLAKAEAIYRDRRAAP